MRRLPPIWGSSSPRDELDYFLTKENEKESGSSRRSNKGIPLLEFQNRRHLDKFSQRLCLHLLHDFGAVDLDGLFADAETAGGPLVGLSGNHQPQHLALASRQR